MQEVGTPLMNKVAMITRKMALLGSNMGSMRWVIQFEKYFRFLKNICHVYPLRGEFGRRVAGVRVAPEEVAGVALRQDLPQPQLVRLGRGRGQDQAQQPPALR